MSILLSPDIKKKEKAGVPDPKKLERTSKDTFVVHAAGGNYFEGKITNPQKVKFKDSGRIILTNVGICIRKCFNRDIKCKECFRFSELRELQNARDAL